MSLGNVEHYLLNFVNLVLVEYLVLVEKSLCSSGKAFQQFQHCCFCFFLLPLKCTGLAKNYGLINFFYSVLSAANS